MKENEDVDPETEELWQLATNTPSRYSVMRITDMRSGVTVEVDQSMDSTFGADHKNFKVFIQEFLNIYFGSKKMEYKGEFDGKHKVRINNLLIDFGIYEGKNAWNWLVRYVNIVINLMSKEGVINLKEMEEDLNRKHIESKGLQQQVQKQDP